MQGRTQATGSPHNDPAGAIYLIGAEEDRMIEDFFKHPYTLRYLRGGSTGPHIDRFAGDLAQQGYSIDWTRQLLRGVAHLGYWLERRGLDVRRHPSSCHSKSCPRQ